jgi:hypothetical protein
VDWNWQRKTEVLRETPVPVPLCQPKISHGVTRDRASTVRGRRLTAWAMARPRYAFFWNFTQRRVVVSYRRFATTNRSHLQGSSSPRWVFHSSWTAWPLKTELIGCAKTSIRYYHSTMRKIPKQHRYHLHRGGSLKSRHSCSWEENSFKATSVLCHSSVFLQNHSVSSIHYVLSFLCNILKLLWRI